MGTSFFLVRVFQPVQTLSRTQAVSIVLVLAAAFVLAHPYTGIRHDGIFYLGEALKILYPARMVTDVYFEYGSQGDYSIMPHLYSALIVNSGIAPSAEVLLVITQLAYGIACWFLLRQLTSGAALVLGLLAAFVLNPIYGGYRIFGIAEPFLTARSFAEPLGLLGLALVVQKRYLGAIAALILSSLFHPLMALPCFLVAWAWLTIIDRRWMWLAVASLIPIGLATIGIKPYSGLFERYDVQWLNIISEANKHCFPLRWDLEDWGAYGFDVAVLTLALNLFQSRHSRRFILAVLIASLAGTLVSIIAADGFKNVLLTGLQFWRIQWLSHWLALALIPFVCLGLWRTEKTPTPRGAAFLIVCGAFALPSIASFACALLAAGLWAKRDSVLISKAILTLLAIAMLISGTVLIGRQVASLRAFSTGTTALQSLQGIFSLTIVNLLLGLGLYILISRRAATSGLVVAISIFTIAITAWDQRVDWVRFRESYSNQGLWETRLSDNARVYWFGGIEEPWVMLHRGGFFAENEAASLLFNRQTAMEFNRRQGIVAPAEVQVQVCSLMNSLNKIDDCVPTVESLADICNNGPIDYIVTPTPLEVPYLDRTNSGIVVDGSPKDVYLYSCNDLITKS